MSQKQSSNHTYKYIGKKYKNTHITLKGGKYIDKGGFGCIIKPALICSKKDKTKKHKLINDTVSKIIQNPLIDSTATNEIKISKLLKKLDSQQHYYLTFNKYCYITEDNINKDIQGRKDIINIHYNNDRLTEFDIDSKQQLKNVSPHSKGCHIDLKLNPLNIIMDYGGYSLHNIIKYNNLYKHKHSHTLPNTITHTTKKTIHNNCKRITCIMYSLFIDNFKANFKHLLLGIVKMHNNKIINRDIKPHNIMLKLINSQETTGTQDTKNKLSNAYVLRYIDFGLSLLLTNDYCNNINNINILSGTKTYISPELFIINKYNKILNTKIMHNDKYILNKINNDMNDNILKVYKSINQQQLLHNLQDKTTHLYEIIKALFANNKILLYYFGSDTNKFNGYLQKSDVYALGLTIFKILSNSNLLSNNSQLIDLLKHMIAFNPYDRYNIIQCINHPYFTINKP